MLSIKEINRYTSNEFHEWQRENLPKHFVMQDIDTWALVWADSAQNFEPFVIVELKRSFMNPESWKPFPQDKPNYISLKKLADKSGLPLWIIYFKKGEVIKDKTIFRVFQIESVSLQSHPWITYTDILITAKDFREKFPYIFCQSNVGNVKGKG